MTSESERDWHYESNDRICPIFTRSKYRGWESNPLNPV